MSDERWDPEEPTGRIDPWDDAPERDDRPPDPVPGFCAVANIDNVREYNYALTPGRYVGASDDGSEDEPFEERFPKLTHQLNEELVTSRTLADEIAVTMEQFSNGA